MVMVSSAILGAAVGSGFALVIAVTIVMYRYYLLRRQGKEWEELNRWDTQRTLRKLQLKVSTSTYQNHFKKNIYSRMDAILVNYYEAFKSQQIKTNCSKKINFK